MFIAPLPEVFLEKVDYWRSLATLRNRILNNYFNPITIQNFTQLIFNNKKYLLFINIFLLLFNKYLLCLPNNFKIKIYMKTKNNFVFIVLNIVAWLIFVGLSIEAGGLIVNFIFSIFNPEMVHNLYQKMDLSQMFNRSPWAFYGMYSFVLVISILKAYLFYIVIVLLLKLDLEKPFNSYVSAKITQISYFTFSIGLLSYVARQSAKNLHHRGYEIDQLNQFWVDSQAFILMAAVVYVIAVIFKKGIEIQAENELTI